MDFNRTWTRFAIDAEYDHYESARLVSAHNAQVGVLQSRLAAALDGLKAIKEHEHQAHGECVAYLSDETLRFANYDIRKFAYLCAQEGHRCCAAIAAATIARVEEAK